MEPASSDVLPQPDYRLPAIALGSICNGPIAEWLTEDTGPSAGEMARATGIMSPYHQTGAQNHQASGWQTGQSARTRTPAGCGCGPG